MFDLEEKILEWRRQMLAAGIKSPVPLEELENHLREEIERQIKFGLNEQKAFEIAVEQIGCANYLKMEFAKTYDFFNWFGNIKPALINQILGVLWLIQSTKFFIWFAFSPVAIAIYVFFPRYCSPHYWTLTVYFTLLALAGIIGSILLCFGIKLGVSCIRILAVLEFLLSATEYVAGYSDFGEPNYRFLICAGFSVVTIWVLHPKKVKNLILTTN